MCWVGACYCGLWATCWASFSTPSCPPAFIGWFVMPIGIGLTCIVLWKWVQVDSIRDSLLLGIGWSAIAMAFDYFFIVKLLNPPDGYYKFDVYLYYLITFALPVAASRMRRGAVA